MLEGCYASALRIEVVVLTGVLSVIWPADRVIAVCRCGEHTFNARRVECREVEVDSSWQARDVVPADHGPNFAEQSVSIQQHLFRKPAKPTTPDVGQHVSRISARVE